MEDSIALVAFSKHGQRVQSKPFEYAHVEVGLNIWNPHRQRAIEAAVEVATKAKVETEAVRGDLGTSEEKRAEVERALDAKEEALKKALGDLERARGDLREANDGGSAQLEHSRQRIEALEADLERAGDERRSLSKALEELQVKYDRMTKMTEKELEKKDGAISERDGKLEALQKRHDAEAAALKEAKDSCKEAAKVRVALEARVADLEAAAKRRDRDLEALKKKLSDTEKSAAASAGAQAAALAKEMAQLKSEIEALEAGRAEDAARRNNAQHASTTASWVAQRTLGLAVAQRSFQTNGYSEMIEITNFVSNR